MPGSINNSLSLQEASRYSGILWQWVWSFCDGINSFSKTEVVESFCFDGIARIFPIAGVIWKSNWPYRELDTLRLGILQLDLSFVHESNFQASPWVNSYVIIDTAFL